jgi:hypothetical protein
VTRPAGATGAIIRNNTVTMSGGDGIYLDKAPAAMVSGNVVTGQTTGTGIRITAGAAGALVEHNVVRTNEFGVEVNAAADLGGGSRESAGGNVFSCNTRFDVLVSGPVGSVLSISAAENAWDHVPPTQSCGAAGDLCQQQAQVSTPGAVVAAGACP